MRKKINSGLLLTATVAIVACIILVTLVYYRLFCNQMMDDLKDYTNLMIRYDLTEDIVENSTTDQGDEFQFVLIDKNTGEAVSEDTAGGFVTNEYSRRPEIQAAFADGEGQSVSAGKQGQGLFCYAVRLENGNVLWVSRETQRTAEIIVSVLPGLLAVTAVLVLGCALLARILTKRLIRPIRKLADTQELQENLTEYEELVPLIDTIQKQHLDILKNARIRQDFTANVSHELKTPLTSISGYAELIENGMASEEDTVRFAAGIHKSASRLLTLINDIIRLSELDNEEEKPVFERLNLYQLAETCVDMLTMNAEKHCVSITLEGTEAYIYGNRQMVEELLYNLCDNAIRYNNENGSVTVSVTSENQRTVLRVKDTGIGIPKEHQERIFERFYRVDKSRSKSTGGTGLGLAIVKHILVKHRAEIELQSEEGKGTVMTVRF